ncbi:MAG: type IX secretion system membrane protein PorP/SprF, partial [Cytophagales bacterium]|nr:type IX secretion system membrane protein PorP/SprF [Cytophagales bacterium]
DIAYSYDFNYSDLNNYNAGSHEVLVGLRLPNHEHKPPPSQFW